VRERERERVEYLWYTYVLEYIWVLHTHTHTHTHTHSGKLQAAYDESAVPASLCKVLGLSEGTKWPSVLTKDAELTNSRSAMLALAVCLWFSIIN
jgi:hypothetical protein